MHKNDLMSWNDSLMEELYSLKFEKFQDEIAKEMLKQSEFERLKNDEKEFNQKIKKITEDERKAKDDAAKQQFEDNLEILELKKKVNETEVESKLHIQYLERQIEGAQSCEDRLFKKTESKMEA